MSRRGLSNTGGSLPPPGGLARLRAFSLPFLVCWRGGVSCVAYRAQLGRLGGSRWRWVLQMKYRAIQANVLSHHIPSRCFLQHPLITLESKTGLMVARATALRINIDIAEQDGSSKRSLCHACRSRYDGRQNSQAPACLMTSTINAQHIDLYSIQRTDRGISAHPAKFVS